MKVISDVTLDKLADYIETMLFQIRSSMRISFSLTHKNFSPLNDRLRSDDTLVQEDKVFGSYVRKNLTSLD